MKPLKVYVPFWVNSHGCFVPFPDCEFTNRRDAQARLKADTFHDGDAEGADLYAGLLEFD